MMPSAFPPPSGSGLSASGLAGAGPSSGPESPAVERLEEGAAMRRRVCAPPPSPVVLSIPHAGTGTTGFEDELAPSLDVRCDADLLVDTLYQVGPGETGGAWRGPWVIAK